MRYAAIVEYSGQNYAGWQRQGHANSVQQTLELALSKVADQAIGTICAGRTDAGVHGTHQIVHFDCDRIRQDRAWVLGCNAHLPADISVRWAGRVAEDFHARFSAVARRYRYLILNQTSRSALTAGQVTVVPEPLDVVAMQEAAQYFLGEHDFSAVRASSCQSLSPWRNIFSLQVSRNAPYIMVDISANAFLHHMVRNITGVLLAVGKGEQSPQWVRQLLLERNRCLSPATASPCGLYLVGVKYPVRCQIPQLQPGPSYWP